MAGIRVVDDLTLEIELTVPNPRFYDSVRAFYALPEHAIDFAPTEIFSSDWWCTNHIGAGCRSWISWSTATSLTCRPGVQW